VFKRLSIFVALVSVIGLFGFQSQAEEKSVAEEILDILKANSQISEEQYDSLVIRARDEEERREVEAKQAASNAAVQANWSDYITWFGDFRGRVDYFNYDKDPNGTSYDDRTRARYRARMGMQVEINPYLEAELRLSSGNFNRTGNQSFGEGRDNFDKNEIALDRAYFAYEPYGGNLPQGVEKLQFKFGKMGAPFYSKKGKDYLIWDSDIAPEGIHLASTIAADDALDLSLNLGYFIVEEYANHSDPHLASVQFRGDLKPEGNVTGGAAATLYQWSSLNDHFLNGALKPDGTVDVIGANSVPDGMTDDSSIALTDLRLWLEYKGFENLPLLLYGNYLVNQDAQSTAETGGKKEDTAWLIGLEGGDKRKTVRLGFAYSEVETNSTLRTFTDSDFLGGSTNRKGAVLYATRQVAKNTDLKLTVYKSKPLEKSIDANLKRSDRLRVTTDLMFKF
jgi:hypothetical protein